MITGKCILIQPVYIFIRFFIVQVFIRTRLLPYETAGMVYNYLNTMPALFLVIVLNTGAF